MKVFNQFYPNNLAQIFFNSGRKDSKAVKVFRNSSNVIENKNSKAISKRNWKPLALKLAAFCGTIACIYISYRYFFQCSKDEFSHFQPDNLDDFIAHQKINKYWGWSISNLEKYFGGERDLYLATARKKFYHGILNKMPEIISSHPEYKGEITPKIAMDICELRKVVREYTRERISETAHNWLDYYEVRDKGCDFYAKKYLNDPQRIVEGAMQSNSWYDWRILQLLGDVGFTAYDWGFNYDSYSAPWGRFGYSFFSTFTTLLVGQHIFSSL